MAVSTMAIAVLPPISGCGVGGGGDGGSDSGSTPNSGNIGPIPGLGAEGTPVSDNERLAALDAIEAEFQRQLGTSTTFNPAAMVEFLKRQPAFYEVGYTAASSCAWAAFTDGRKLLVVNNVDVSPPPPARGVSQALPASLQLVQRPGARSLSSTNFDEPLVTRDQFRLMNMFPGFPVMNFLHVTEGWVNSDGISRIGRIAQGLGFTLVDQGTMPDSISRPKILEVEGLKEVSGDGVFFINGSGGFMDTSDGVLHGICTMTPAKIGGVLNKTHESDLDNGRLIYATTPFWTDDGREVSLQCLAITPRFVFDYVWKFPDESLVFLNVTGNGLIDWLNPLQNAGAGLILGWNGSPNVRTMLGAAQDFFEMLFATNHVAGSWPGLTTEPRMRPYGIDEVYSYLINQGLFAAEDYGSGPDRVELLYGTKGTFINQLRPSIQYLSIDENNEVMQIQGEFGKTMGNVRIGTQTQNPSELELSKVGDPRLSGFDEMSILDWKAHLIRVDLSPGKAPRETGMVQVWLGGRYSNVAHLTRWRVTFHLNRTVAGQLHRSADIEVVIRAFVSGYRLRPDQTLEQQWQIVPVTNMKEGKVGYSASGSLSKTEAGTTTTITWSGAGNFNFSSLTESFALGGVFVINSWRLDCTLEMGKLQGLHVKTDTATASGTSTTEHDYEFSLSTPEKEPDPGMFGPLSLYFDQNWVLSAGSVKFTDTSETVLGKNNCETTIFWESAYPDHPPEPDRGGR